MYLGLVNELVRDLGKVLFSSSLMNSLESYTLSDSSRVTVAIVTHLVRLLVR
jgi:hypothetical protein